MTGSSDWTPPDPAVPPGWSPRQPPPYAPHHPSPQMPPPGPPPAPPFPPYGPPFPPYGPPFPPPYAPPGWRPPGKGPGVIPLRPLGLGEILDGAITYIRRNPRVTLGLSAIVVTISSILQLIPVLLALDVVAELAFAEPETVQLEDVAGLLGGTLTALVVAVIAGGLAQVVLAGMLASVVGRAVLGRHAGMGEVWREVRGRLLPLLGLAALLLLIPLVLVGVAVAPIVFLAVTGVTPFVVVPVGVLLVAGVVVLGVYVYVKLALAAPALVLERTGVIGSLGRSWALVRGSFWRVLGITLLAGLIAAVVGFLLQMPFAIGQQVPVLLNPDPAGPGLKISMVIGSLGQIVAGTVAAPFSAGVAALLYVDRRIRREGLDMALHAAVSGTGQGDEERAASPWEP